MTQRQRKAPEKITYKDEQFSIIIRPLREEDAEPIHHAVLSSRKTLLPFMDWAHLNSNVESQVERIQKSHQNYISGHEYDFGVFDSQSNEFLMSASLHASKTRNKDSREIGYWTVLRQCNKGLATLVTKILTVTAFEIIECDRVEIGCNRSNKISQKVIKKCGFKFEGEIHNYFNKPTEAMLKNSYSADRTYLLFAYTDADIKGIDWYEKIKRLTAYH